MTEEQIERFFKRQCTPAEAMEVVRYFRRHPDLLEKYEPASEWEAAGGEESMPAVFWEEIWQTIHQKKTRHTTLVLSARYFAAASVLLIAAIGYFHFNRTGSATPANQPLEGSLVLHKTQINHLSTPYQLTLPDGSVVSMAPGSSIKYDIPFGRDKRDVQLSGEADFKVAKDEGHPFTVYSGGFATTALGTEFRVIPYAINGIIVRLLTGKVVVRPMEAGLKGWKGDVYLVDGQQMRYDGLQGWVAVSRMKTAPVQEIKKALVVPVPAEEPKLAVVSELVFDGTPLSAVMDSLADYYHMKIHYDSLVIRDMNFSGTVSRKDSLAIVLRLIAQMNDLNVIEDKQEFLLQKKLEEEKPENAATDDSFPSEKK